MFCPFVEHIVINELSTEQDLFDLCEKNSKADSIMQRNKTEIADSFDHFTHAYKSTQGVELDQKAVIDWVTTKIKDTQARKINEQFGTYTVRELKILLDLLTEELELQDKHIDEIYSEKPTPEIRSKKQKPKSVAKTSS